MSLVGLESFHADICVLVESMVQINVPTYSIRMEVMEQKVDCVDQAEHERKHKFRDLINNVFLCYVIYERPPLHLVRKLD